MLDWRGSGPGPGPLLTPIEHSVRARN